MRLIQGIIPMTTAKITDVEGIQTVTLPPEFSFTVPVVSIRKVGDAVILEPAKGKAWPEGFFDEIQIEDPAFTRPEQGPMPPAITARAVPGG